MRCLVLALSVGKRSSHKWPLKRNLVVRRTTWSYSCQWCLVQICKRHHTASSLGLLWLSEREGLRQRFHWQSSQSQRTPLGERYSSIQIVIILFQTSPNSYLFNSAFIGSSPDLDETIVTPVGTPRVFHQPIVNTILTSISNHQNCMVLGVISPADFSIVVIGIFLVLELVISYWEHLS